MPVRHAVSRLIPFFVIFPFYAMETEMNETQEKKYKL